MALSNTQIQQVASYWANTNFVQGKATAIYSVTQIQTSATAVDNAFDTTLSVAVAAVGGNTTIINGLSSQITASMPGATAQQQTLLCCYVLMKRAGII